jgi:hypothetical protein
VLFNRKSIAYPYAYSDVEVFSPTYNAAEHATVTSADDAIVVPAITEAELEAEHATVN